MKLLESALPRPKLNLKKSFNVQKLNTTMTSETTPFFLRTFYGQTEIDRPACSMARFPVEQFDKAKKLMTIAGFSYTDRVGVCEMDWKHVFTLWLPGRRPQSLCFRRKNGEDCWNICQTHVLKYDDVDSTNLTNIFTTLKNGGVDLRLPTVNWEYIPPQQTTEPYPDYERYGPVDPVNIENAQVNEKKWHDDMVTKVGTGSE
jgi:hypothetical protein